MVESCDSLPKRFSFTPTQVAQQHLHPEKIYSTPGVCLQVDMKMLIWPAERKITFKPTGHLRLQPATFREHQLSTGKLILLHFRDTDTHVVDFRRIESVPVSVLLNPGQCVSDTVGETLCSRSSSKLFQTLRCYILVIFRLSFWLSVPYAMSCNLAAI